jgi:multidrug resistance protein
MRGSSPGVLLVVGLAFFTDTLVYSLLPPLLPHYARTLGLSQFQLGLMFASYAATLLGSSLPLGRLVDRIGRRGPFLLGLLGLGASTLLFAFSSTLEWLLVARGLQGIAAAATWVCGLALLADHFPSDQRGKAMSTAFACANLGLLAGPYVSGLLVERGGPRAPFLAAAALAGLDAVARLVLLPAEPPRRDASTGYAGLLRDPAVRVYAGAMALAAGLGATLESVLPLHADKRLGMGPAAIGLGFTVLALASTFTSPLVGHWCDRNGPRGVVTLGLVLGAALVPLCALAPTQALLFVLLAALGAAQSLVMSATGPALSQAVERRGTENFGTVFSLLNLAFALGILGGPLVSSALAEAGGTLAALLAVALGLVLYVIPVRRA